MGIVYEATQVSLNRTVALKVLESRLSDDRVFRERFRREGQIQASIDHPHILTVHEAGETEHGLFLAMHLVRGPNLKDMIVARDLDAGRTLRVLVPVADALDTAHAADLIHRDIKPQNILVDARDHPYLADFGLIKAPGDESLTRTGQFVGTLDYISPEQIRGERATARSDVYSLAAVLYECLTGIVPFPRESEAAVLFAHLSEPPPLVTDARPDLPRGLDEVVCRAMATDPDDRHASASELMRDAELAFGDRRAAFSPPGPIERPEEIGIRAGELQRATREAGPLEGEGRADAARVAAQAQSEQRTNASAEHMPHAAAPQSHETVPAAAVAGVGVTARAQSEGRAKGMADPRIAVRPDEAPDRSAERLREWIRRSPVALAAPALLLVLIAGFLTGRLIFGDEPSFPNSASTDALGLTFPDAWQRVDDPPRIPGLHFEDRLALAPDRPGRYPLLVAGQVAASGPALLPRAFLRRLGERPRPEAVRLHELAAYRYRDLRPRGFAGRLTLFVVPTTRGVATVACAAERSSAELGACGRIAQTLELVDGKPYPLGADERYADTLDQALGKLRRRRGAGRRRLAEATTPSAQAGSARDVASAYGAAATALARASVGPAAQAANRAIVAALKDTQAAYGRLASTATRADANAYREAASAIRRAEARVERHLRALRPLGYSPA